MRQQDEIIGSGDSIAILESVLLTEEDRMKRSGGPTGPILDDEIVGSGDPLKTALAAEGIDA